MDCIDQHNVVGLHVPLLAAAFVHLFLNLDYPATHLEKDWTFGGSCFKLEINFQVASQSVDLFYFFHACTVVTLVCQSSLRGNFSRLCSLIL